MAGLQAVRTGRLVRYFEVFGDAISMASYSGSITDDSITDYSALAALSLKRRSPLPLDPHVSDVWATAIDPDPNGWKAPMGALRALVKDYEDLEDGFARLLRYSPGFVITSGASVDIPLEIRERPAPEIPNVPRPDPRAPGVIGVCEPGYWPGVQDALDACRDKWVRPDGELFLTALEASRCARELACGLFLKWKFIRGETKDQVDRWKAARKEWRSELREMLKQRRPHMDSPMLCALAAMRAWGHLPKRAGQADIVVDVDEEGKPVLASGAEAANNDLPSWKAQTWCPWYDVRKTVQPITEDVRLDPFLAQDAANWALENKGIVWYQTVAFGKWVAELSGLTMHGGGQKAGERLAKERGDKSIICSIKSHGTGRDGLQRLFATQLIAQPLSSAVGIEQLLGRLSRIGQEAEIVHALVYRHTKEIRKQFDAAIRKATYVAKTLKTEQKLLVGWNPDSEPQYNDTDLDED